MYVVVLSNIGDCIITHEQTLPPTQVLQKKIEYKLHSSSGSSSQQPKLVTKLHCKYDEEDVDDNILMNLEHLLSDSDACKLDKGLALGDHRMTAETKHLLECRHGDKNVAYEV